MHGRIVSPTSPDWYGADLIVAAAISDTTLIVDDIADFNDEDGGWLTIGESDPIQYETCDDDDSTITLAAGLTSAYPSGEQVRAWDTDRQANGVDYVAVITDDDGEDAEVILPHGLIALSDEFEGASVTADESESGELEVTNVLGWSAQLDGGTVAPGTIDGDVAFIPGTEPNPGPSAPPTTSPAVTVYGTVDWLILTPETAPEDYATFEFHLRVKDDSAFVPSPATLVPGSPTRGVLVASALPDGTPLEIETTYEALIVATNDLGEAAPGPVSTGTLDPEAVTKLITGVLVAGFILTGRIQVGDAYFDADEGLVIPQPGGGAIRFPVDGTQALLDAYVIARGLTVTGDATFMQLLQVLGRQVLANGVTDPTGEPGVSSTWGMLRSSHLNGNGEFSIDYAGLAIYPNESAFVSGGYFFGGYLRRTSIDGQTWFGDILLGSDWNPLGGVTRIANAYYVLGLDSSTPTAPVWEIRRFNATDWVEAGSKTTLTGFDPASRPAIGNDGTDLLIAYSYRNGNGFTVDRRGTGGGLLSTNGYTHGLGRILEVAAISGGSHDYAEGRYVIWPNRRDVNNGKAFVFVTSTGFRTTPAEFGVAGGTRVQGAWWDGTRFRHLDKSGQIWSYGSDNPTDTTLYARYTHVDANPAGTGTHETAASPAAAYMWPARTMPIIDGRPAPDAQVTDPTKTDKANIVRIYAGASAATCRLQATLPVGENSYTITDLDTGSTIAPTTSSFGGAATAPGTFESAALGGDSSPLTYADGAGTFRALRTFQSGTATIALSGESTGTATITFAEPFATPPRLGCLTDNFAYYPTKVSVSTTGAVLRINHRDATSATASVQIDWTATTA